MESTAPRVSRRFALQAVGGAVLALPIAAAPRAASARRMWCRTDPVVTLNGHYGSVYVSAALEDYELNNSSGDIVIEHPKDVATKLIWVDPKGYFGQGISTNFAIGDRLAVSPDRIEVRVKCYIPASRNDMQLLLEWAPGPVTWNADGTPMPNPVQAFAQGVGNKWIVLQGTLPIAKAATPDTRRAKSRR